MLLVPPISFRQRDHAVSKLVRRGFATDDELFEAQFGEWSVRGLDKTEDCSDIIHFKGFFQDKNINPLLAVFRTYPRIEGSQSRYNLRESAWKERFSCQRNCHRGKYRMRFGRLWSHTYPSVSATRARHTNARRAAGASRWSRARFLPGLYTFCARVRLGRLCRKKSLARPVPFTNIFKSGKRPGFFLHSGRRV